MLELLIGGRLDTGHGPALEILDPSLGRPAVRVRSGEVAGVAVGAAVAARRARLDHGRALRTRIVTSASRVLRNVDGRARSRRHGE